MRNADSMGGFDGPGHGDADPDGFPWRQLPLLRKYLLEALPSHIFPGDKRPPLGRGDVKLQDNVRVLDLVPNITICYPHILIPEEFEDPQGQYSR